MFIGLGLAFMTKEKIEEFSKELVEKGKLSETEGKEFIDELQKKSEEARKKVEDQIKASVRDTLEKMNIPTRDNLLKLEEQVEELKKFLKEEKTIN